MIASVITLKRMFTIINSVDLKNEEDGIRSAMRNGSFKVEPVSVLNYHAVQYPVSGSKFN